MSKEASDPLIGKVLSGRFEIIAPIGVGGMGRVYKAIQRPLDRVVALKVLNPRYDGSRDPGFEKRFFLEASMTAKLKHPNTITVHDYGRTDDGIYFLAMEYIEGETLQHVLAETGPMQWPRALFIGAQIARSLREAHKLGLVHRDLKPANVMLLSEGTSGELVKVLDFGLVKSFMGDTRPREPGVDHTEITQAGVLLGSPMYMSPEQARNVTDQRSDIYALGVVLFQAIAGRPPFVGKESIDVIVKHIREKPPQLRELVPDLPGEVHSIIMKCLEKAPEARFQNMDELLEAMRIATSGQGMSGVFVDPRTHSNPQNPRSRTGGVVVQPATPSMRIDKEALPDVPDSISIEFPMTGAQKPPSRALLLGVVGVVLIGISVGGVIAFKTRARQPVITPTQPPVELSPQVKPEPVPVPVDPVQPKPAVANANRVVFDVTSEPLGATVTRDGEVVGVTPLSLTLERSTDDAAQVELAFKLDGYLEASVVAQGLTGTVPVRQVLQKKSSTAPPTVRPLPKPKRPVNPKTDNPPGYKEDPYQ